VEFLIENKGCIEHVGGQNDLLCRYGLDCTSQGLANIISRIALQQISYKLKQIKQLKLTRARAGNFPGALSEGFKRVRGSRDFIIDHHRKDLPPT